MLAAAIVAEVVATLALKASDGFSKPGYTLVALAGYGLGLWLLTFVLETVPTGVAYAIWAGAGLVLITLVAWLGFGQKMDMPALAGMALIIAGVMVINLCSKTAAP